LKEKDTPKQNVTDLGQKRQEKLDEKYKLQPGIFQNWQIVRVDKKPTKQGGSTDTPIIAAKRPDQLIEELKVQLPNFINVNGELTELRNEPQTGLFLPRPRWKPNDVEASLYAKNAALDFKRTLEGAVRWEPLVIHFADCVDYVTRVTKYPTWPVKPDHLVLVPGIEPEYNGSLDRLIDFFCPETETDRKLIKALFVTPAWSEGQGKRPLFLVMGPHDAASNVSIGKSKLAEKLQKLYQAGADFPQEVKPERWLTTIMEMQHAQIVRFDNVRVSEWSSTILERIVTSEMISGHKHGVGHREYPNHITFVATINDPHLNDDLASRAIVIRVKKPETYGQWERNVDTWIEENRKDVLRDIGSILMSQNIPDPDMNTQFRFPQWKETILNKIDANLGEHIKSQSETLKTNSDYIDWLEFVIDKATRYSIVRADYTEDPINSKDHNIFVGQRIMQEWFAVWAGCKPNGSSKGELGKKLKKICLEAGMIYTPQLKVKGENRSGYWLNPQEKSGSKVAITTQTQENRNVHALRN